MKYDRPTCHCKKQTLNIKLKPAADSEKLAFLDTVCGLLIESRFGPCGTYYPIVELNDLFDIHPHSEEMPDEFFDLAQRPWAGLSTTKLLDKPANVSRPRTDRDLTAPELTPSPCSMPRGSPVGAHYC